MKYLSEYMHDKQSQLFKETNAFFAFSQQQFNEGIIKGNKYTSLGGGLFCPSQHVKKLTEGLEKIYRDSIKEDIKENGLDKIIIRELYNHECFYTGCYTEVVEKLTDYPGITKEMIKALFYTEIKYI